MFADEESRAAVSAGVLLPRRFPKAVEADYIDFSLRVFRPGIRAWHTASLTLAALLLIVGTTLYLSGYGDPVLPVLARTIEPLKLLLIAIAVCSRAVLCVLSWQRDLSRNYVRVVLPLVLVGHLCVNVIFASEIFGSHPGYLAAIAVYAFGVALLSGLQFRQSLLVNGAALCVLLACAWHQPIPLMSTVSVFGHIGFALAMASVMAIALERSVRTVYLEQRRVGEMASRDGLTGLKNRRSFDEHLQRVWTMAIREKRSIGVLLIDVDFFKAFNDSLGHQAGDAALQNIATVVAATARRPMDLSARYGGEELAIILYDVTREYVMQTAQRVQYRVAELKIQHPKSSVAPVVTVSTGVAFVRPSADRSPQGAISMADRGLYAAKRAGRNQYLVVDRDVDLIATGVFSPSNAPAANAASD